MTHLELSNSASRRVWHIIRRNGQTLRDSERYFPRRLEYYQDEPRVVYTEPDTDIIIYKTFHELS